MMRLWLLRILRCAIAGLLVGAACAGLEVDFALRTEVTELLTAVQRVQLWAAGVGLGAGLGLLLGTLTGSLASALLGQDDDTKSLAFYSGRDPLHPWLPQSVAATLLGLWAVLLLPRVTASGGPLATMGPRMAVAVLVPLTVMGLGLTVRSVARRFDTVSRGFPILVLGPLAIVAISLSLAVSAPMAGPGTTTDPKKSQHDVVLITIDGLRADHIGPAPFVRTPNLEWMAALGAQFTQLATPSVAEAPPLGALMTGRHPLSNAWIADEQRLPAAASTLAEQFRDAGWSTGAFLGSVALDGLDTGLSRGFDTYDDAVGEGLRGFRRLALVRLGEWFRHGTRGVPPLAQVLRKAPATVKRFWEWQTWHSGERTFTWIHLSDPRNPTIGFEAPPETLVEPIPGDEGRSYAERVVAVDTVVGKILETLDQDGTRDKTVIAVVGTRGYVPGGGRPTVADTWAHVPLLIFGASTPTARRVDTAVRLIDVGVTLLQLAGVPDPKLGDGHSLLSLLEDVPETPRDTVVVGLPNREGVAPVALRSGTWKLVRSSAENEGLFMLDTDPTEIHDSTATRPEEVARASATLTQVLGRPLPRVIVPTVDFGRAAKLRALR